MLKTIRKEVGLSNFSNVKSNEALGFFVNDISCNPKAKENAINAKYRIKMIRFELFIIDCTQFIYLKRFYSATLRPIFGGLKICIKHLIVIPLGKIIIKLFPKLFEKLKQHINE
ncbi:MAG TPA: hypothetical protein GXZ91_09685 [Christensenellaceae bacterium]|nr:hypothetical protein [Christensenellaceae bacterium]